MDLFSCGRLVLSASISHSIDYMNTKVGEIPNSIVLFSYGSISLAQLRGRISPPLDKNECALAVDYERIFAGFSSSWGGGVASLHPREGARTLGSIVNLTLSQLKEFSAFEYGYELKSIDVIKISNQERMSAVTFIKEDPDFILLPSEAYLTAIHSHLQEACTPPPIEIVGYSQSGRVVMNEGWRYPDSHSRVGIPAFLVIANSRRVSRGLSSWAMPATMVAATNSLEKAAVHSVNDLSVALHNTDNFKQLLQSTGCEIFDEGTLATLNDLLLPSEVGATTGGAVSPENHISPVECASEGEEGGQIILLFVYGSLLSGLHNFHLLERSAAVYVGPAETCETFFLCSRGPGFSFPYVTKMAVIPGQTPTKVKGEVYRVPSQHLPELDRLENHPHWYRRQQIQVSSSSLSPPLLLEGPERNTSTTTTTTTTSTTTDKVWIYILENEDDIDDMKSKPDAFHDVSDGDWKKFLRENSKK